MNDVTETASAHPVAVTEAFEAKVTWFGHLPSSGKAKAAHRRRYSAASIPRHGTWQQNVSELQTFECDEAVSLGCKSLPALPAQA